MSEQHETENLLTDTDSFAPSKKFAEAAIAKPEIYTQAKEDRLEFWAEKARELHWHKLLPRPWILLTHPLQSGLRTAN